MKITKQLLEEIINKLYEDEVTKKENSSMFDYEIYSKCEDNVVKVLNAIDKAGYEVEIKF